MTKRQLKEIEDRQRQIRRKRNNFISSVEDYWKDCNAAARYFKTHDMNEKIRGRCDIIDEEKEILKSRYNYLDDIKVSYDRDDPEVHTWSIIRCMVNTYNEQLGLESITYNCKKFETIMGQDDIYFDDILWGEKDIDLLIKFMKEYGYKRIQYFCTNSGAMEDLYHLTKRGLRVVGTNAILSKNFGDDEYSLYKTGLVIDIGGDDE